MLKGLRFFLGWERGGGVPAWNFVGVFNPCQNLVNKSQ